MKDFFRDMPMFSLCGLNCAICSMHVGGYCPGCGGGDGNQSCVIARCSAQHGNVAFCFECGEYPCGKYDDLDKYDSFIPCSCRQRNIERAQNIGINAYLNELSEKAVILSSLIENYNDGRRKTLFNTAMHLFDLEDIRTTVSEIERLAPVEATELKQRAAVAAELFNKAAKENGITLKLNKKPKKRKRFKL